MWTYTDDHNVLPNLYIRSKFKDGTFMWFEVYPCEGYVLRIYSADSYQMDEDGNYVLDESGNKILEAPYYSDGGAMVRANYNWEENPNGFVAEVRK